MLRDAINKICEMSVPTVCKVGEIDYADRELHEIKKKIYYPSEITLQTLTGFLDFTKSMLTNNRQDLIMVVHNPYKVSLTTVLDERMKRRTYCEAHFNKNTFGFCFGKLYAPEDFIINLFSNFEITEDLQKLMKLSSGLTSSSEVVSEDDGITQRATVKKGVALKEEKKIENPVSLIPKRTFTEIKLPQSKFVFRVHSREGEVPKCALYEADGALWELAAISEISEFIKNEINDVLVVS